MKDFSRTQRMGDQMQRELAQLIQQEISDPRMGMVTVSGVQLSRDLAHAKVFVTVFDNQHDAAESVKILNGAAGFLRHGLARRSLMRVIPKLRFVYDSTVERGATLAALINSAVSADADADSSSTDANTGSADADQVHPDEPESQQG